jgi:hypothetical protein
VLKKAATFEGAVTLGGGGVTFEILRYYVCRSFNLILLLHLHYSYASV